MRTLVGSVLLALALASADHAAAQTTGFQPGWYIVEECAEYFVMQPSTSDAEAGPEAELLIAPGEVVLAFEGSRGTVYAFESHGRMSALRPARCLTAAPVQGRPAYVSEELVTMSDIKIMAGSTVWMLRYNTANRTAVVRLAGGKELEVPSESITLLSNAYSDWMRTATFAPVSY